MYLAENQHPTVCVERRKLVGVSAERIRGALGAMATFHLPMPGAALPRWQEESPAPGQGGENPEEVVWSATTTLKGTAPPTAGQALFRAEIRPMAPLWSEVTVQIRYAAGPGPLAWLAAHTVLRWRLRAGLKDLLRAVGRCTAPAWARGAGTRTRLAVLLLENPAQTPAALRPAG